MMDSKQLRKKMKKKLPPKKKPSLMKAAFDATRKLEKKSAQRKANGHQPSTTEVKPHDDSMYIIDGTSPTVSKHYMEKESSTERAEAAFAWLIAPVSIEDFYEKYFERRPFVVRHRDATYYQDLFSTSQLDSMLHDNVVYFEKNIDLTSYENGQRNTILLEGRANPALVWQYFSEGCSVRLLNPQSYIEAVHSLCFALGEHFSSFVGANVYLTPAARQGFAPHWDDIDAFVLQLEGRKHWKVYEPRSEQEVLPLRSSGNLNRDELVKPPILDVILDTGDLLYMPRGFIHEAVSCDDVHSLHITMSANQRCTWSDYLKLLLPAALEMATESNVAFRRSVPRAFLQTMGVMHADSANSARRIFSGQIEDLLRSMVADAPLDPAADQFAVNFMHDSLPVVLRASEKELTASYRSKWNSKTLRGGSTFDHIHPETRVRLVSKNCVRVASEADSVFVYHIADNTNIYRERDEPYKIEISPTEAIVIEHLVSSYPAFVKVKDIHTIISTADDVEEIIHTLYSKNLLLAK